MVAAIGPGSVSDIGSGQEPLSIHIGLTDSCVQPDHDQRNGRRVHLGVTFPNVFSNPSAVNRTTVGYNLQGLFKNGVSQIPSFGGSGGNGEAALVFNPGGFEAGGPSQGLVCQQVHAQHERHGHQGYGHAYDQGGLLLGVDPQCPARQQQYQRVLAVCFSGAIPSYTTGDSYADEVLGIASNYNEASFNRINDIAYNTYEFFVQDDWKVTKRLTVNYGIRFSHFQPWYDRLGFGYSIFDVNAYNAGGGAACSGCADLLWIRVARQGPLRSDWWIPDPRVVLPAAPGCCL